MPFLAGLPFVGDALAAVSRDPALRGARAAEVFLHPGLWAVWSHRVAHGLHRAGVPVVPRAVSQLTRAVTGVEIHPGARIGRRMFIDHASGVVIGETARVGDDVTLYHRVTLGGRGPATAGDRHPHLGDRVVVGVGASILGPVDIGDDARIGAHAVVTHDVPARAAVHPPRSEVTPPPSRRPRPAAHA